MHCLVSRKIYVGSFVGMIFCYTIKLDHHLQVEALAQVGGVLVMNSINDPENHIPYLAGIEKFRFRKMVIPGDTLIMRCKLLAPIKRGIAKMRVEAFVDNYLVGEGNMTATITKKNNE